MQVHASVLVNLTLMWMKYFAVEEAPWKLYHRQFSKLHQMTWNWHWTVWTVRLTSTTAVYQRYQSFVRLGIYKIHPVLWFPIDFKLTQGQIWWFLLDSLYRTFINRELQDIPFPYSFLGWQGVPTKSGLEFDISMLFELKVCVWTSHKHSLSASSINICHNSTPFCL